MQRRDLLQLAATLAAPLSMGLPALAALPNRQALPDHLTTRSATPTAGTAPLAVALAWRGAKEDSAHQVGAWRIEPGASALQPVWSRQLPSRPHGLFVEEDGHLLVVAMRPGRWLMRLDPQGHVVTQIDMNDETLPRRLDGHVITAADRGLVFTVETDRRHFTGLVGVRDARTLKKLDEWSTHGVDPHQLLLDRAGDLVVANGGLWRTLEGHKRDLDRMDPSLVKLDGRSGALRAQWRLDDPRLSIRHLAWAPAASTEAGHTQLMGVALQAEHDDPAQRAAAPLLALYDGQSLRALAQPASEAAAGYAGDIAAPTGRDFVVSAQRAGEALRWQDEGTALQTIAKLHDVCGLAALPGRDDAALVVTGARGLGLWHPQRPARLFAWPLPMAVDNHVVVLDATAAAPAIS